MVHARVVTIIPIQILTTECVSQINAMKQQKYLKYQAIVSCAKTTLIQMIIIESALQTYATLTEKSLSLTEGAKHAPITSMQT